METLKITVVEENKEVLKKARKPRERKSETTSSQPKKDKVPPKWMEECITAKCKHCNKLYIAEKLINKGWMIIYPDGKTRNGSHECFYYCNEECLNQWTTNNPNKIPKPEPIKKD